jgi:hypothetical protein
MAEADPVMRAARNGFGVLMVAILALWAWRFRTSGPDTGLFDLLLLGGLVFWGSQLYYRRQDNPAE